MRAFDVLAKAEYQTSGARRSRAITSRWRCCGGFICASWYAADVLDEELLSAPRWRAEPPKPGGRADANVSGPGRDPAGSSRVAATASTAATTRRRPPPPARRPRQQPASRRRPTTDQAAQVPWPDVRRRGGSAIRTKAALLAEIKRAKKFFHGTVVAQAQRIEFVDRDRDYLHVCGESARHSSLSSNRIAPGWSRPRRSWRAAR